MTRQCRVCGRESTDLVRNTDLDVDWCPDARACLDRAAGLHRAEARA